MGNMNSHGDDTSTVGNNNKKWRKCHIWGMIFLVVIIAILSYFVYNKTVCPKTYVSIDIPKLGLPTSVPDIVVFPDAKI